MGIPIFHDFGEFTHEKRWKSIQYLLFLYEKEIIWSKITHTYTMVQFDKQTDLLQQFQRTAIGPSDRTLQFTAIIIRVWIQIVVEADSLWRDRITRHSTLTADTLSSFQLMKITSRGYCCSARKITLEAQIGAILSSLTLHTKSFTSSIFRIKTLIPMKIAPFSELFFNKI